MEEKYEEKVQDTLRELERLREKFDLDQGQIADKIGVVRTAYSQWVNPDLDIKPSLESWLKIKEFLGGD